MSSAGGVSGRGNDDETADQLTKLKGITGRDVFLYASDNEKAPPGFTRGGRQYARYGEYTLFHAAHEMAHNMPEVLSAIEGLIRSDAISYDQMQAYAGKRAENIARSQGASSPVLSNDALREEFACDVFGAVMYARQTGDESVYDAIGISKATADACEAAIIEALASDSLTEEAASEYAANAMAAGDGETRFSSIDVKEALDGNHLTDENAAFIDAIYEWDGNDHRGFFRVGRPSKALKSVGVPDVPIHLDQSKAVKISEAHPEMGNFIFWAIPEILNDPIVITESSDYSLVVYGETEYRGHPLDVVLRIKTTQRGNASIETCKVRSSYLMNSDAIAKTLGENGKNVVFLGTDKNRTNTWFKAIGRSTPFGGTKYGPIRMLSYADAEINSNTDFSENNISADRTKFAKEFKQAERLFFQGVDALAYQGRKDADPYVSKFLRGMAEGQKRADVLNEALDLFQAGKTPYAYYQDDPKAYNHQVARQLRGMLIRNGQPVGGALGQQDLERVTANSGYWKQIGRLIENFTSPGRLFEKIGAWRSGKLPGHVAKNYQEGKLLRETYVGYGQEQMANKELWIREAARPVIEAVAEKET